MFSLRRAAVVGTLFTVAACSGTTSSTTLSPSASLQDKAFIGGAGQSSNAEIAAAHLALQKSSNADVISFANEMIDNHTTQNAQLAPVAATAGTSAPTDVDPEQAAMAQQLAALSGTAFDAAYVNGEIKGHTENLNNNFVPEVANGTSRIVKNYAVKFEPQIQMHLQMAQALKTKYGF